MKSSDTAMIYQENSLRTLQSSGGPIQERRKLGIGILPAVVKVSLIDMHSSFPHLPGIQTGEKDCSTFSLNPGLIEVRLSYCFQVRCCLADSLRLVKLRKIEWQSADQR